MTSRVNPVTHVFDVFIMSKKSNVKPNTHVFWRVKESPVIWRIYPVLYECGTTTWYDSVYIIETLTPLSKISVDCNVISITTRNMARLIFNSVTLSLNIKTILLTRITWFKLRNKGSCQHVMFHPKLFINVMCELFFQNSTLFLCDQVELRNNNTSTIGTGTDWSFPIYSILSILWLYMWWMLLSHIPKIFHR